MSLQAPTHDDLLDWIRQHVLVSEAAGDGRIDLHLLADQKGVSVTPVREVLYRLVGEGLVDREPNAGFRIHVPDASELKDLYAWVGSQLLSAVHLTPEPILVTVLHVIAGSHPIGVNGMAWAYSRFEDELAGATGNREFGKALASSRDRLQRARRAETQVFSDLGREFRALLKTDVSDVRNNVRRRILAYHRRRVEHAPQIAAVMSISFRD